MLRPITAAALTMAVVMGACGGSEPRSTPVPRARTDAYVVRSGYSIREGRVGVGALVRVRGDRAVKTIRLGISLFAKGRRIGRQQDTLPYCPASTDCWWAQGFYDERSVDRVTVEVVGTAGKTESTPEVQSLPVIVRDDEVVVTPSGEEGTAYIVAMRGRRPSFGISFFARRNATDELRYGKDLFPITSADRVLGVLYPGPIPPGAYGPAD